MKLLKDMNAKETAVYFLLQCVKNPFSTENGCYFMHKGSWEYSTDFYSKVPKNVHWIVKALSGCFTILHIVKGVALPIVDVFCDCGSHWNVRLHYASAMKNLYTDVLQIFDSNATVILKNECYSLLLTACAVVDNRIQFIDDFKQLTLHKAMNSILLEMPL